MSLYEHSFDWLRPEAPYAPFVELGLLAALRQADPLATVRWEQGPGHVRPHLVLICSTELKAVASALIEAPWPDLAALPWQSGYGQAIKPVLAKAAMETGKEPVEGWRRLTGPARSLLEPPEDRVGAAQEFVAALLTDAVLDQQAGLPGRSRLLRGVKADLSGIGKSPKAKVPDVLRELELGPQWKAGESGLGVGLVPEVQTFGGVTGPTPNKVGAYSPMLYFACWRGIAVTPPRGVVRGINRVVGGALIAGPDRLRWPIHQVPVGLRALQMLLSDGAVLADDPDRDVLRFRGMLALYESRAREVNSMIALYATGERLA